MGLDSAKRLVRKLISDEESVHGVLLYGVSGSGKSELARILAEGWMCLSKTDGGADGTCQSCRTFSRGSNPDLFEISPQGASQNITLKFISPASDRKPDDPVSLREFFRTPPIMARHKVAIIHRAHRLGKEGSNALLKMLEEPFPYAKLILTTDSIGGIQPTILSRCLAVVCQLPTSDQVNELSEGVTEEDLRLAEGAPGRLKTILENPIAYRSVAAFARTLPGRGHREALKASEEFRQIAEAIEKASDLGTRAANAEARGFLAICLAREPGVDPMWTHLVIEAHRRIQGNASAGLVFDALFSRMLHRPGHP